MAYLVSQAVELNASGASPHSKTSGQKRMLAQFSFRSRLGLPTLMTVAALGAGCQTADQADPNSTVTVQGDFQDLAGCYALSQKSAPGRVATAANGARSVSVSTVAASQAAADALGRSDSKSAEEAVDATGAASYRVTFGELPNNSTRVSGNSIGAATQSFFWFETVLPALRRCTNNPDFG